MKSWYTRVCMCYIFFASSLTLLFIDVVVLMLFPCWSHWCGRKTSSVSWLRVGHILLGHRVLWSHCVGLPCVRGLCFRCCCKWRILGTGQVAKKIIDNIIVVCLCSFTVHKILIAENVIVIIVYLCSFSVHNVLIYLEISTFIAILTICRKVLII